MAAQWDGTAKNAHVLLLNGNLTANDDGIGFTNLAGRATAAAVITSGSKKYWETTINSLQAGALVGPGVANASETFGDDQWLGSQVNGFSYFAGGGVFTSAVLFTTLATFGAGDVVGIACIGAGKIWFRVNGGNWNNDILANQNPATNTGGIDVSALGDLYPAYGIRNEGTQAQVTGNFGATAPAFAAPSGFTGFDISGVTLMGQVVMG